MRAEFVSWVTGEASPNRTGSRFAVRATDLGISWQTNDGVLLVFGDTYGEGWGQFGAGPRSADWRNNVLAQSKTVDPSHGITLDDMIEDYPGHATQILRTRWNPLQRTLIPTAGIEFAGSWWIHAMSVRRWKRPGMWSTNHATLWCSTDGLRWQETDVWWPRWEWWRPWCGDGSRFQMAAFVRDGEHVLMFGTPAGRWGNAHLAWSPDMFQWQYWTGDDWGADPAEAVPVMKGPVAELSVIYHKPSAQWLAVTLDESRGAIVLRTAPVAFGPWTAGETILTHRELPGLYGGFLHPASANGDLHLLVSAWPQYQVALFRLPANALSELPPLSESRRGVTWSNVTDTTSP